MKTFEIIWHKQPRLTDPVTESHRYTESWEGTKYYCPNCGNPCVWEEQSAGDYYVGTQFICVACAHTFHMPEIHEIKSYGKVNEPDVQRLAQLLAKGKANE